MCKKLAILVVLVGLLLPTSLANAGAPLPPANVDEHEQKQTVTSIEVKMDELEWKLASQATIESLNTSGCKANTLVTSSPLVIDDSYVHADVIFNRCQHVNQAGYWYIFAQATGYAKKKLVWKCFTGLQPEVHSFSSGTKIADRNPAATYNADKDPINVNFGVSYGGASAGVSFPLYKDKVTPTTTFTDPVAYKSKWSGYKCASPFGNSVTVLNEWVLLINRSTLPSYTMKLTVWSTFF